MKYIIVNSVKDGNRYLRTENKKKQNTTYNVKCIHLSDLAKEVVIKHMAKDGNIKALDILQGTSGADILIEVLEKKTTDGYFIPNESISGGTCEDVLCIMEQLRMGAVTQAYTDAEDISVIQLKDLINTYEEYLSKMNIYDLPLLYKTAIRILKEDILSISKDDSFIITDVCKAQLTAMENDFLSLYTDDKYTVFPIKKTLEENNTEYLSGAKFFKSYGIANEINYVISQILDNKQNLGDVEIFYSSADYEPYIEACFAAGNIPYAMINRQLPTDNIYFNVMKHIIKWVAGNYTYEDLKPVMILSKYRRIFYSQIKAGIGWGKERYKAYIDSQRVKEMPEDEEGQKKQERVLDFCSCLEELLNVFDVEGDVGVSLDTICERLLMVTRRILGNRADYKYVSGMLGTIYASSKHIKISKDINEIIAVLTRELNELTYSDSETTSAVCIRKLDSNVHILERKHIYVLGMSNAHYSGSLVESPVLSDKELTEFIDMEKGRVALRKNEEELKRNALLATLASRDRDGTLTIGYCCYDTVNLRSLSPSIPYIRMVQKAGIREDDIANAGYENIITGNMLYEEKDIWKSHINVENVDANTETEDNEDNEDNIIQSPIFEWSTTSLQQMLGCPRQFYYQRVLFLPNEDYKLPKADSWLPAGEKGTLAHGIVEDYCNVIFLKKTSAEISPIIDRDLLKEIMNNRVEEILKVCPYISKTAFEMECEIVWNNCINYLEKMHKEFSDTSNKWMVVACEELFTDINIQFNSGDDFVKLNFRGQMDRVDCYEDEDGIKHYRIIDYKSGNRNRNEEKIRLHHNVQHIVYKLALERMNENKENVIVDEVRFLHFFEEDLQNQEIILTQNDIGDFPMDVHDFVVRILKEGKYSKCSISDGSEEENAACKYCTYKDICDECMGEKL